jgi:hypothetical protein
MTRLDLAKALVRLFPRMWRQRYEDEILDTMSRSAVRLRDLADLVRSAADEWEHHLARSRAGTVMFVAIGYFVLGAVWIATGLAGTLLAVITLGSRFGIGLDSGFFAAVPAVAILFLLPMYVVGLVVNLPLFTILRLARHRVPLGAARCVAAIGMACWGEWMLFQMEWFDVWRHGVPGTRYWMTTLLPWGVAWACAGAVIGGSLVRNSAGGAADRGRAQ